MSKPDTVKIQDYLLRTLAWSRERDYAGYSKHDALRSPLINAVAGWSPPTRLVAIQGVMRFPVNLRPALLVRKGRNPKGIGLFAHAYLDLADCLGRGKTPAHGISREYCLQEAEKLLGWLIKNASSFASPSRDLAARFDAVREGIGSAQGREMRGMGWGYHYPWQDVGFFQPAHFPNRVVTCWIGFAFLRAHELIGDDKYLDAAKEIAVFLLENPRRKVDEPERLCLSYVPVDDINVAVMDVSALAGAMCAGVASRCPADSEYAMWLHGESRRLMNFVVDKQTDYGAWFYTWPAGDSHIKHDNYHTAIILDCIADYMKWSGDTSFEAAYARGLAYYREALFLPNGAPRWMNDKTFPHDIHGSASGILTFSRKPEYLEFAGDILSWTLAHLYDPAGYFRWQKTRFGVRRTCLMRWCNAWMSRAMSRLLLSRQESTCHPVSEAYSG